MKFYFELHRLCNLAGCLVSKILYIILHGFLVSTAFSSLCFKIQSKVNISIKNLSKSILVCHILIDSMHGFFQQLLFSSGAQILPH